MNNRSKIAERLEPLLGSQLRLQLIAELRRDPEGLTLAECAVRTACPEGDVVACLKPLVALGVLEELDSGRHFRIRAELDPEVTQVMKVRERKGADHLRRQHHVRHQLLRGMIGTDPKMQLVTEMVRKVARLDVPVLITGETGTGKELVARAIHELSGRREAPFGDVNCATFAESLFESHVFGHARGAFTGAVKATAGLVEHVGQGTLFLDEIGELGLPMQAKLLKVLQSKVFTRVGETVPRRSSFRLVSATNRHLPAMVAQGAFREDLFYRINVFPIRLPALRERLDDLPQLVEELAARTNGLRRVTRQGPLLTSQAMDRLLRHTWPGNIRELENVVTRALIAAGDKPIDVAHLTIGEDVPAAPERTPSPAKGLKSLSDVEREHVVQVLGTLAGNVSEAAAVLGVSRTTLYRMMERHGIHLERLPRFLGGGTDLALPDGKVQ